MLDLVALSPDTKVFTRVGGLIFKLRLFDLRAVVWAEAFFSESDRGGLNAMYYILGKEPKNKEQWRVFSSTVADVAFYLSEGLEIKTPEEFKEKINASNPSQVIAVLSKSITEVLKKSFPSGKKEVITGGEIFKKAVQGEEQKPVNWAKVYADFYRAGGATIDQFYSMTMLQIDEIYSQIDEGKTREKIELMQFDCSIHGVKKNNWPKMPVRTESKIEIDQDEIERRKEEHAKLFNRN